MAAMSTFGIMRRLALRNLLTHKVGSSIVGGIIVFGTFLVVVGTSLLDTVDTSMQRSITASLAGHLQVYAADAQDELALFGGGFMGSDDIGTIPEFETVRHVLEQVDNVAAVLPMGTLINTDVPESPLDRTITLLRRAIAANRPDEVQALAAQLRTMASDVETELLTFRGVVQGDELARVEEQLSVVRRVQSDRFWQELAASPEAELMYLDSKLAPISLEGEILWMRNVGTDLERFPKYFDRFELVRGEKVPEGERGILVSERFLETFAKNLVARELDEIYKAVTARGLSVAADPTTKDRARRLPAQYRRITLELRPADASALAAVLRRVVPGVQGGLTDLLKAFLAVDDDNIRERHAQFYEHIAPRIRLYRFNVGDTITLRSYTKAGYIKSLNLKVYGIYRFKGLEESDLAGGQNLIDLPSFRELYGVMTDEKLAELKDLRATIAARDIGRDEAEAALFGGGDDAAATATPSPAPGSSPAAGARPAAAPAPAPASAPASAATAVVAVAPASAVSVDKGLALHSAIVLKDPSLLRKTQADIAAAIKANGLNLKVVDWLTASGIVGQLIIVIRIVLYVAIFIIFLVALAIINNSMVIATMERTYEIGTMRALGARRGFVTRVVLLETVTLGIIAGSVGVALGAAAIGGLGNVGIPATSDIMIFLFSGPRLYPSLGLGNVIFALGVILTVSLVSTIYPARLASRVPPVVAMQSKE